jgi:hypothetical protein
VGDGAGWSAMVCGDGKGRARPVSLSRNDDRLQRFRLVRGGPPPRNVRSHGGLFPAQAELGAAASRAHTYVRARTIPRRWRGCELSARIRATVFARCAARLRDGQPCGRTVSPGSEFCSHHASLVEVHGVDALKEGLAHRRASSGSTPPKVVTENGPPDDVATVSQNGSRDPATVRPRLAEAVAEGLEGIRKTLLDAATGAVRDHWVTFECGECGTRRRVEVPVPDVRARVAAIELLLREGLGRPPQAEETPAPRLPASVGAVAQMSWDDLQIVGATLFAGEIAAVSHGEGDTAVRERLASLTARQRAFLRDALAEPEPV